VPKGPAVRVLISLVITAVIGFIYFYVALPAINLHAVEFYFFVGLLCVVYFLSSLLLSGMGTHGSPQEVFGFLKRQCKIPALILAVMIVIFVIGAVISMPIFRASAYRDLLVPTEGDFAVDVQEISFDEIAMLDEDSARRLGDRQMGNLPDMVSQFEVSDSYTQINYQGRPVRVAPLEYASFVKWLTNRGSGLPAYVIVDMASQEASVVRLDEGIKYSTSEPLNRNIDRYLRFHYPTYLFGEPTFEIDEEGNPWWVCPRVVMRIGLFGGEDIQGAVLVNAVTGESQYYEEVPTWVDRVYLATLIMEQYDYHGTYINGFFNSIFGQKDVTVTTDGWNYIAMNDDVYMYTGVTSVNSDQSNLGFLLSNQRTKETKYYAAAGATEESAQDSAEGVVQDLGYTATFPLLLNVSGQPTYFLSLKDSSQLVKQYAMINVSQYQVVATGASAKACEEAYVQLLAEKGLGEVTELPTLEVSGAVQELHSAVIEGTTWVYVRLSGDDIFYALSAADNQEAAILNVGDFITLQAVVLDEGEEKASIVNGTLTKVVK
jgi:hypothetical protein